MYLITGDFETAELLIDKAISINQSNPKYYISMVEVLYNTDRKKDAVEMMEKIVKLRPTNPSYLLTLADLYLEIQDY
jgi:tetratricopeptide (TPR) repeat protein